MVDEKLTEKLRFIREGEFQERQGAPALRLVGKVQPVGTVEVVRSLTATYPLAAMELAREVELVLPGTKRNRIWQIIHEDGLKENRDYSAYNFRNKGHEDAYLRGGRVPPGTPSIYSRSTVEYLVDRLTGGENE